MHGCHELPRPPASPTEFEVDRRGFVKLTTLAAGVALYFASAPRLAFGGEADALLLTCIDYRMLDPMAAFMKKKGLDGKYDQVILAGASLGVVSDKFKDWHETFWQHLDVAIELHKIHEVIVIDHRDCGAYRIALGPEVDATPAAETQAHSKTLRQFAKLVRVRHPELGLAAYLMALDGAAEKIAV